MADSGKVNDAMTDLICSTLPQSSSKRSDAGGLEFHTAALSLITATSHSCVDYKVCKVRQDRASCTIQTPITWTLLLKKKSLERMQRNKCKWEDITELCGSGTGVTSILSTVYDVAAQYKF